MSQQNPSSNLPLFEGVGVPPQTPAQGAASTGGELHLTAKGPPFGPPVSTGAIRLLTPTQHGQLGAEDAVQHIPPTILAQMHDAMQGMRGQRFIADQVRVKLPEAARLWLEPPQDKSLRRLRQNAWGGFWQSCYVAKGTIVRTGRRFPALRKACRGRLQDEWEFAS